VVPFQSNGIGDEPRSEKRKMFVDGSLVR